MAENKEEKKPPAGSKLKWIIIGLAFFALAGGAGGFGYFYFKKGRSAHAEPKKEEPVRSTVSLEPFLVNLADKNESRFVKASFRLGFTEADKGSKLSANPVFVAAARDAIISLLTSKTSDQLLTPEGKTKLREEVQHRINESDPEAHVREVFIVDFIVQL